MVNKKISKIEHTRGPWFYNQAPSGWYYIYPDSEDDADSICIIKHFGNGIANAKLIAAAPELLNELETLTKVAKIKGIPTDAADSVILKIKQNDTK